MLNASRDPHRIYSVDKEKYPFKKLGELTEDELVFFTNYAETQLKAHGKL